MNNQTSTPLNKQVNVLPEAEGIVPTKTALSRNKLTYQEDEQIRHLLEQHSFVLVTDTKGMMTYVSDSLCRISQYSRETLLGKNAGFMGSRYHSPAFFQDLWGTVKAGKIWRGRIRNRAKDGTYFWVDMMVTPLLNEAGVPTKFVGIRRDITETMRMESQLAFQSHILAHVNEAVVGLDGDYRINFWNQGAERLYLHAAKDVLGKPLTEAYTPIWIREQDEQEAYAALEKQGYCQIEIKHQLKNGNTKLVEVTTRVIYNEAGEQDGLLAVVRDITDRKQTEHNLQRTMRELQQRNNELDNYVYKVSHDLRGPLSSMQGLLNLMQHEPDTEVKDHYLRLLEDRVIKLDTVILSILQHARLLNEEITYAPIDFQTLIASNSEEFAYHAHREKINITTEITGHPTFYSDTFRINLIIKNLISNSVKYLDLHRESSFLHFQVRISPQEAIITVQDNGIGIDEQLLPRIFNMFFRGTSISEGSGLGLYIVRQAVNKLQGHITVSSQRREGTTFVITLPNHLPQ